MNLHQVQALTSEHDQLMARVAQAQRRAGRNLGIAIVGTALAAGGGAYLGWWWRKRKECACKAKVIPEAVPPNVDAPKNGNGNGNGNVNGNGGQPPQGGMVPGDS